MISNGEEGAEKGNSLSRARAERVGNAGDGGARSVGHAANKENI